MQSKSTTMSRSATKLSLSKMQVFLSLALLTAISCHIQQVQASGIFEINFSSLVDAYGRDLRDECCNWQQNYTDQARSYQASKQIPCDPSKCQLIIRICVKNYQITQIEPSQCFFGELSAQVMKSNEAQQFSQYPTYSTRVQQIGASQRPTTSLNKRMFGQHHQVQSPTAANIHHHRMLQQQQQASIQNQNHAARQHSQFIPSSGHSRNLRHIAFQQSISFPFNFTWPGSFSLIVDAWYESAAGFQQVALPFPQELDAREQQTTTYDLYKKQLIITHSMRGYLSVKNEWTNEVHKTDTATLAYSYRVTCQPNYYGEQCNILCKPRDDVYGHFTCSPKGDIVCLTGWSGSYCREPICALGCHQGNCSRPNKCNCRLGWQGPACDECIRYPGCVHGTCGKPYECNCQEGWGGLLCNEDLKYCTNHQPCQNGGLCVNTFHSEGAPYTCTCPPGFAGKDCEEAIVVDQPIYNYNNLNLTSTSASENVVNSKKRPSTTPAPVIQNQVVVNTNNNQANTLSKQLKPPTQSTNTPQSSQHHQNSPTFANIINSNSLNGIPSHYTQAVMQQPQQPFEVVAAYVVIIVCMVILVVFLLLKIFFDRTNQRPWSQDGGHVEDVATLQNHQNIYKSRTSLSADKMHYDTLNSTGTSSSSSSPSTSTSNINTIADTYQRRLHRSHHNLHQNEGPLNPPPPYTTISHTHPNLPYINSIYNGSIYGHPSTNHTLASNAASNPTTMSLYTPSTHYGQLAGPVVSSSANYYGSINSTYQSPRYMICQVMEVDRDTLGAPTTTTATNQHPLKSKSNGQK